MLLASKVRPHQRRESKPPADQDVPHACSGSTDSGHRGRSLDTVGEPELRSEYGQKRGCCRRKQGGSRRLQPDHHNRRTLSGFGCELLDRLPVVEAVNKLRRWIVGILRNRSTLAHGLGQFQGRDRLLLSPGTGVPKPNKKSDVVSSTSACWHRPLRSRTLYSQSVY